MPRILAIANRKGGVGKTTTTVNVATAMAAAGKKVLVVDLDPQGNASTSMGVNKKGRMNSTYEVLVGDCKLSEAIVWTEIPNFSLVPSSPDLARKLNWLIWIIVNLLLKMHWSKMLSIMTIF